MGNSHGIMKQISVSSVYHQYVSPIISIYIWYIWYIYMVVWHIYMVYMVYIYMYHQPIFISDYHPCITNGRISENKCGLAEPFALVVPSIKGIQPDLSERSVSFFFVADNTPFNVDICTLWL